MKPASPVERKRSKFPEIILNLLTHLVTIPVFIMLHRLLPELAWPMHLDRILLFIATLLVVEGIIQLFKGMVITLLIVSAGWLTYGSIFGDYGFVNVYNDYRAVIHSLVSNPYPEEIISDHFVQFPNKNKLLNAIEFDNPDVRNFALMAATANFKDVANYSEYRTLIQCMSIFTEIRSRWQYVYDPRSREYFAKASETVQHFAGDCDDHATFMAACIKAIGGTSRLVLTTNHLYPELLIGKRQDMSHIDYLITRVLFKNKVKNAKLSYHIDERNNVWLNMDYTAKYPGGKFMSEEVLGVLKVD